MYKDNYKTAEKKMKKELLMYTTFCLHIVDMINPANKKDLMNTMQKESIKVARKVVKY